MMHAIIIGSSGAIAMNLIVSKNKQVEKQWKQQVVVIAEHNNSDSNSDRNTGIEIPEA